MILTRRALMLTVKTLKRVEAEHSLDARNENKDGTPLVAKALALGGVALMTYYAARWVFGPVTQWIGESFPDAARSPTLSPVLRALGVTEEEAMGIVPGTIADSARGVQPTPGLEDSDLGRVLRQLRGETEFEDEGEIEPAPIASTSTEPSEKIEPVPLPPARAAGAPQVRPDAQVPKTRKPATGKTTISKLKGEAAGVALFRPRSDEEQAAFNILRAQKETFRGGSGLTAEIRGKITAAAKRHGLEPDAMLTIAMFESGGNPNAVSSTGAVGLYQFTGGTAKLMGLSNRFNADDNIEAAMRLTKANIRQFENANAVLVKNKKVPIPIDLTHVYLAHQLGAGGALNVHNAAHNKGELSSSTKRAMGYNLGEKGAIEYIDANTAKLSRASALASKDTKVTYNDSTKLPPTAVSTTQVVQTKPQSVVRVQPQPKATPQTTLPTPQPVVQQTSRANREGLNDLFVIGETLVHI